MGGGTFLFLNYDEKWFWGMVTRSTAHSFDEIDTTDQFHINETMAVVFTGYAFEDRINNGGEGVKLGYFRAQSNKVAKRQVK